MIEYLIAKARIQAVDEEVRRAEWVRWWPARPANMQKERGL